MNNAELIKWYKAKSFMSVRMLLKDELILNLDYQMFLSGTGVVSNDSIEAYQKLKKRNDDNRHLDKIRIKYKMA